jgi:hypothetical protein
VRNSVIWSVVKDVCLPPAFFAAHLSHTIESSQRGAEKDALPSLVFSGAICVGHTSGTHYKRRKLIEAWRMEDVFKAINLCICYFCVYFRDGIVFQQSGWTKDVEKAAGRHHQYCFSSFHGTSLEQFMTIWGSAFLRVRCHRKSIFKICAQA